MPESAGLFYRRWIAANGWSEAVGLGMPVLFAGMDLVPWAATPALAAPGVFLATGVAGLVVGAVHGRVTLALTAARGPGLLTGGPVRRTVVGGNHISRGGPMSTDRSVVRDGVTVGLIAYAAVALFYAVFDLLAARGLLHTVDLLGKAVFRGLRDPAVLQLPIEPDMGAIFWYNGLHLVLSLLIGMVVVRLIAQAERHPEQGRMVLAALIAGFVVTVLAVGLLTAPMRPLLPWWSIVVANLVAVGMAGTYLVRRRPGVTGRLLASAT